MSATMFHSPRAFVGTMCCYVLNRGHGLNQGHARIAIFLAACFLATSASAGEWWEDPVHDDVLFVVGPLPGLEESTARGDSFVLSINLAETAVLSQAYALVDWVESGGHYLDENRPEGWMPFGAVGAGSDGVNRNVLADGEPLWSWHITEFVGFLGGGFPGLDSAPSLIEQDIQGGADNYAVAFTGYTVVSVLSSANVPEGVGGDINLDGSVNRKDLAEFVTHFGENSRNGWSSGDFDRDGKTGLSDLALLQSNIGETALPGGIGVPGGIGAQSVPEPNTMALLFAGAASLLASRRRRRG